MPGRDAMSARSKIILRFVGQTGHRGSPFRFGNGILIGSIQALVLARLPRLALRWL